MRQYKRGKQTAAIESGSIYILLADDHPLMRQVLVDLLESQDDFRVVGQAVNGAEAVQLATELKPDVVLMDVFMPKMNGFDAIARIRNVLPDTRIIGLSMHNDTQTRHLMLSAGAIEFLSKSDLYDKLEGTIRGVHYAKKCSKSTNQ